MNIGFKFGFEMTNKLNFQAYEQNKKKIHDQDHDHVIAPENFFFKFSNPNVVIKL